MGVAGFPSGEAYKVGDNQPYVRLPRVFVRQTLNLDGRQQAVGLSDAAGRRHSEREPLVFTVGKISVGDIFDNNQYAHDPRNDFLNWAVVDAGTFDYAADAWAYTIGGGRGVVSACLGTATRGLRFVQCAEQSGSRTRIS